jgi:hypothetical protein
METKLWGVLDYLDEHGWCKYSFVDAEMRSCLAGAANRVINDLEDWESRINSVIMEQFPERLKAGFTRGTVIMLFNDHPLTTYEDVKAVVTKAAIKAEEVIA